VTLDGSHSHKGPHFTLVIWPSGKTILTTPDDINRAEFETIRALMQEWFDRDTAEPLVIGNCRVILSTVPLREVEVE
jgi:hypothetical protein